MKKMKFTDQDGKKSFNWVVWGEPEECILFGENYNSKGWAIRRAKKRIDEGEMACVVKRGSGYFQVMFGNALSSFIFCGGFRSIPFKE